MTAPAIDREAAMLRTFQAAFAALDDLRSKSPAAASRITDVVVAHLKSSTPMAMLDTGPVAKVDPAASVERELADGSRYVLAAEGGCTVLKLREDECEVSSIATLTPVEAIRFIDDVKAVNGG